jgi:ABC-type tungstate transport system substrate-binding protein
VESQKRMLPAWLAFDRIRPAVVTGLVLFAASYTIDLILSKLGVSGASTLLNDIAIGILGALFLLFYLSASYEKASFERLKERMALVADLNRQVREAVAAVAGSAMIEDREERLRQIDQAIIEIDDVLARLGPAAPGASGS